MKKQQEKTQGYKLSSNKQENLKKNLRKLRANYLKSKRRVGI